MTLLELKYRVLEWPKAISIFIQLSPLWRRWLLARAIAHNQCVVDFQTAAGIKPEIAPLVLPQELEFQEVVEDSG